MNRINRNKARVFGAGTAPLIMWPLENPKTLLWSFADTCRALGISRSTGERLSRQGAGAFPRPLRIGARRFHRPEDVQAWLAAKAEKAA